MNNRIEKGFTLIEMLVIMLIMAVLGSIAVPNLSKVFKKSKLRTCTTSVTSSLYLARMKAINEGEEYGVEFFGDGLFQTVRDPYGVNEVFGSPHYLDEGVIFKEITFNDWLAVFKENGQLHKDCLQVDEMTGTIILSDGSTDSTWVDVTFLSGRIRETNR